jgi:hypothetical protein
VRFRLLFPECEIGGEWGTRTRRCRSGHSIMGQCGFATVCAAATLLCTTAVYAAETTQRTDPVDPACLQRDAPPEKCVVNNGPPPPPRARGTAGLPQGPITPSAPAVPGPPLDAGSQRPPGASPQPHPSDPTTPAAATPTTPAPATPSSATPATPATSTPSAGSAASTSSGTGAADGATRRRAPSGRTSAHGGGK